MKPRIPVTDHAVLRWMEHAYEIDIEAVRRKIRQRVERAVELASSLDGQGTVTVAVDGLRFVVKGGTVVTITGAARR